MSLWPDKAGLAALTWIYGAATWVQFTTLHGRCRLRSVNTTICLLSTNGNVTFTKILYSETSLPCFSPVESQMRNDSHVEEIMQPRRRILLSEASPPRYKKPRGRLEAVRAPGAPGKRP